MNGLMELIFIWFDISIESHFHVHRFMDIFILRVFHSLTTFRGLTKHMQCHIKAVKNNRKFSSILQRIYYKTKCPYSLKAEYLFFFLFNRYKRRGWFRRDQKILSFNFLFYEIHICLHKVGQYLFLLWNIFYLVLVKHTK